MHLGQDNETWQHFLPDDQMMQHFGESFVDNEDLQFKESTATCGQWVKFACVENATVDRDYSLTNILTPSTPGSSSSKCKRRTKIPSRQQLNI